MMVVAGISLILFILYVLFVLIGLSFFITGTVLMIIAAPKRKVRKGKFALAILFLSIGTAILSLCILLFVFIKHSFSQ
jgi:hypothetical protein